MLRHISKSHRRTPAPSLLQKVTRRLTGAAGQAGLHKDPRCCCFPSSQVPPHRLQGSQQLASCEVPRLLNYEPQCRTGRAARSAAAGRTGPGPGVAVLRAAATVCTMVWLNECRHEGQQTPSAFPQSRATRRCRPRRTWIRRRSTRGSWRCELLRYERHAYGF